MQTVMLTPNTMMSALANADEQKVDALRRGDCHHMHIRRRVLIKAPSFWSIGAAVVTQRSGDELPSSNQNASSGTERPVLPNVGLLKRPAREKPVTPIFPRRPAKVRWLTRGKDQWRKCEASKVLARHSTSIPISQSLETAQATNSATFNKLNWEVAQCRRLRYVGTAVSIRFELPGQRWNRRIFG